MTRAQSMVEMVIRARAAEHPGSPWLHFGDDAFTWAQTLSRQTA